MKIFFDPMESAPVLFCRALLILLTIAVVAGAVFLIRYVDQGFWDQGGGLYVTLALLLFFGWVIGQFVSLARRQKRMELPPLNFTKTQQGPSQKFTFTLGAEAAEAADRPAARARSDTVTLAKSFSIATASAPEDTRPTPAQIEQADLLQREGRDWETICVLTNPQYGGWPAIERQVYNVLLQALVAAHRAQRGER
ncbi:MAG: hypothetical protein ACREQW_04785 [Candidatus Binatia bacterium]